MRVLAITNIFPNRSQPLSAPFNRQQFAQLAKRCQLEVIATVPWFPGASRLAPKSTAAATRTVPWRDVVDEIPVRHLRTLHLPKVGTPIAGPLFALSLAPWLLGYRRRVDVVLGSWAYPDGWAAIQLARMLRAPVVIKVHGSDLNTVSTLPGAKQWLRWGLPKADGIVAVSRALARRAQELGVDPKRVHVVMNGVDAALFHVRDRKAARQALALPQSGKLLLFVGNLKAEKGVRELLAAFEQITPAHLDLRLAVLGDGDEREAVAAAARKNPSILALGAKPITDIPLWLAASDALVLPSWNEGTPNVVLEALACGRRVVASDVGGIPDLIDSPIFGQLVTARDPMQLANAMAAAAAADYDPQEVARHSGTGSWEDSAEALFRILASVT